MKKLIIFALCLFWSVNAFAAEKWYATDKYSGKCKVSEGPAALIKVIQNLKKRGEINSKVTDEKVENGKPVIVRVYADDGVTAFGDVFYRSKELCKEAVGETNKKNAAEVNRYK
jgi:hypothetical protein